MPVRRRGTSRASDFALATSGKAAKNSAKGMRTSLEATVFFPETTIFGSTDKL